MKDRSLFPIRYQSPMLLVGTWVVTVALATVGVQLLANSLPAETPAPLTTPFAIAGTPTVDPDAPPAVAFNQLLTDLEQEAAAAMPGPSSLPITLPALPPDLSALPVPAVSLPSPPPIPSPALPAELRPVLNVAAPAVAQVCAQISTTGAVLGFAGPSTPGGIAGQLPGWLTPAYTACGSVPASSRAISCAADPVTPTVAGVPELPYTLTPFAMVIHEILALEEASGAPAGAALSNQTRTQLGCTER
jgi:hypothetical protein